MANPFPVLTVKIKTYDPSKLSGQLLPDSNRENIVNQLKNATVWLPDWAYPLKDGDEVTVVGRQAFNLYQLINQLNAGSTSTIETLYFGVEPNVLNFVLTANLLFTSLSWTPNSIYRTYAEYKIDDGDWVVIRSFDKGTSSSTFDFTGIAQIDQTAYIRLRFGNGTDFFSSWNTQSVVLAVPSVENIVITGTEYPYVFDFSWTQSDTYYTYIEYKVNDGSWTEYPTAPPGISSGQADASTVMTLGDTLYVRLRFSNGVNYSAWSEESITPYILFAGNTLPDLNDFSDILHNDYPAPILTLYDNNVVVDHPEYMTEFQLYASFDGNFDFRACSNVVLINLYNDNIANTTGCQISGCSKLGVASIYKADLSGGIDLTGCNLLYGLDLVNCLLTNTNFLNTLPNKNTIEALSCRENNITSANMTGLTNISTLDIGLNSNLNSLDLTGCINLSNIKTGNCPNLTSLDLSESSVYNYIDVSNCNISELTIADGLTNDSTSKTVYYLLGNNLSTESLNAFFTALGSANLNKKSKNAPPTIFVPFNPGAATCDPTIATAKGWGVYTAF